MRLLVARCEVLYTGRLTARLPEAVRLLMFKADGSFLVHDDAGGYRPLNRIRREFRPEGRSQTPADPERLTPRTCVWLPLRSPY
ncbi:MAG: hypothetical protein DMD33_00245 [Gemmatimonadetes bacterium]|nr:MAG: hypothetical protein DMD33_00245 [Gemmatimonadota bacterium]